MADNKFETPEIREYPIIPKPKEMLCLIVSLLLRKNLIKSH